MLYLLFKTIHILTVSVTAGFFCWRWRLALAADPRLQQRWVRILPHLNDTLLLTSAIVLAAMAGRYPFVNSAVLTAKVCGLIVYILLGTIAIKRGRTRHQKLLAGVLALLTLAYIVAVAISKNPLLV